ncbi:MAG TPA: NADH-quinone oxidoreductase subunit C [Candidatus Omnitrophota bacterium]|nr:NADH-quinone oxidoreductase subunit C [Candidatus Omnitrophota bacterium]
MTAEEAKNKLTERFGFLASRIVVQRERRLTAETDYRNFAEIFDYAVNSMKFSILCTITGLDEGERLTFIYHLADESGAIFNLKTSAPKSDPVIKTVMNYFPAAEIYERELIDLLGAKIDGMPEGKRYPLPDDWPKDQYPLRKDWKQPPQKEGNCQ